MRKALILNIALILLPTLFSAIIFDSVITTVVFAYCLTCSVLFWIVALCLLQLFKWLSN